MQGQKKPNESASCSRYVKRRLDLEQADVLLENLFKKRNTPLQPENNFVDFHKDGQNPLTLSNEEIHDDSSTVFPNANETIASSVDELQDTSNSFNDEDETNLKVFVLFHIIYL